MCKPENLDFSHINYSTIPAYSIGKELLKRWKVRQISERIYDCLRADWSDVKCLKHLPKERLPWAQDTTKTQAEQRYTDIQV